VNLYHIMVEGKELIIVIYVDDLVLTGGVQSHMKHRRILWGKPQLKTPPSVLSYKWKYLRITQSFSSQAIQLLVQFLSAAYR